MSFWRRINHALGFDRASRAQREYDLEGRSRLRRMFYFLRPVLALFVILYTAAAIWRLCFISSDDLDYPVAVLAGFSQSAQTEAPADAAEAPSPDGAAQLADAVLGKGGNCRASAIAAMETRLIDILVNDNVWVPADPQFKTGWFFLVGFPPGPFFDNKASFQLGALRVARRVSIEMADILGRLRGTSAADEDLTDARGLLQWSERAWLINPFDDRLPLFSSSAAGSYRNAMERIAAYNQRLATCDASFDARGDNLFQFLDRLANEVGGMVDELSQRSATGQWDVGSKRMIDESWGLGWLDMRADNLFHEARGMMWALHGILQAARIDFAQVIDQRNLDSVWDRMEAHIAESASLDPLIVSNGAEDAMITPAHLSSMGVNMLRARANMTEIREILNR